MRKGRNSRVVAGFLAAAAFGTAQVIVQEQAIAQDSVPLPRPSPRQPAQAPQAGPTVPTPDSALPAASSPDPTISADTPDVPVGEEEAPNGERVPTMLDAEDGGTAGANAPIDLTQPPPATPPPAGPPVPFTLEARMSEDMPPIDTGVVWRVFGERRPAEEKLPLLAEVKGGTVTVDLAPGSYLVHAAYGRAGVTKRVTVAAPGTTDTVLLNAGGIRLAAYVGKDRPLTAKEVTFDIYAEDDEGGRTLVVRDIGAEQIVRLNAGTYGVISRYGEANATVRADIRVEPAKLTEATVYHQASRVTLKLVGEPGGEALPTTAWSVLAPTGDSVFDSVGAFPSVILAAGDYTAIAKHDGDTYETTFTVETDLNRDVEVIAR